MPSAKVNCAWKGGISIPAIQIGEKVVGPYAFSYGDNVVDDADALDEIIKAHEPTAMQFGEGGFLSVSKESKPAVSEDAGEGPAPKKKK